MKRAERQIKDSNLKRKYFQFRTSSYLRYIARAKSRHAVHSPFVFDFILHVLDSERVYYDFEELQKLRTELKNDHTKLEISDFGAGSDFTRKTRRKVSSIARQSASPPTVSEMLYRLVHYYKLHNMLELGTNLGLTSLYLSKSDGRNKLVTIEGDPSLAQIARRNFQRFNAKNITLLEGEFSQHLPKAIEILEEVDFAFVDGNHKEAATLQYFEKLLGHVHENSILVFDDIHWSSGMEKAWKKIQDHPSVVLTIDWFRLGFVFFRQGMEKQHFVLKQRP